VRSKVPPRTAIGSWWYATRVPDIMPHAMHDVGTACMLFCVVVNGCRLSCSSGPGMTLGHSLNMRCMWIWCEVNERWSRDQVPSSVMERLRRMLAIQDLKSSTLCCSWESNLMMYNTESIESTVLSWYSIYRLLACLLDIAHQTKFELTDTEGDGFTRSCLRCH